jgi:uncharacterized protein YacL
MKGTLSKTFGLIIGLIIALIALAVIILVLNKFVPYINDFMDKFILAMKEKICSILPSISLFGFKIIGWC